MRADRQTDIRTDIQARLWQHCAHLPGKERTTGNFMIGGTKDLYLPAD